MQILSYGFKYSLIIYGLLCFVNKNISNNAKRLVKDTSTKAFSPEMAFHVVFFHIAVDCSRIWDYNLQ